MINYLWLDDERPAPDKEGWDWIKDFETLCGFIEINPVPRLASLDHDLSSEHYDAYIKQAKLPYEGRFEDLLSGAETPTPEFCDLHAAMEDTGLSCVHKMIEHDWLPEFVVVHTMNPWGRKNMVDALTEVGYQTQGTAIVPSASQFSPYLRRQ